MYGHFVCDMVKYSKTFAQQFRLLSACRAPPELEISGHAKIQCQELGECIWQVHGDLSLLYSVATTNCLWFQHNYIHIYWHPRLSTFL